MLSNPDRIFMLHLVSREAPCAAVQPCAIPNGGAEEGRGGQSVRSMYLTYARCRRWPLRHSSFPPFPSLHPKTVSQFSSFRSYKRGLCYVIGAWLPIPVLGVAQPIALQWRPAPRKWHKTSLEQRGISSSRQT